MERRLFDRLSSKLGANLYIDGIGKIRCTIRDVSQAGVSILLEQTITITDPEINIYLLADGMDEAYSLKLQRHSGDIIALTFID